MARASICSYGQGYGSNSGLGLKSFVKVRVINACG